MMIYSVFFYALFAGLTAFAADFWIFCLLRCITGFAMGSEWCTGVALLAETWPNRARPKGAGFLQSGFGFGTLIAALVWLVLNQAQPLGEDTWRSVFVVGPDKKVKLTLTYPAATGRDFNEILRVIDSLQLTAKYKVATPVDWRQGEDVIITTAVSDEEAKERFPGYETVKPYLRKTPQPVG